MLKSRIFGCKKDDSGNCMMSFRVVFSLGVRVVTVIKTKILYGEDVCREFGGTEKSI
jgi:hypothetical protein